MRRSPLDRLRSLTPRQKIAAAAASVVLAVGVPVGLTQGVGGINVFVGQGSLGCGFDFCDEFTGGAIDTAKWTVMDGHADSTNSEPGCYRPQNVTQANGELTETVKAESFTCNDATGSNTHSLGAVQTNSYSFTYGTVEVRGKFTSGSGPWSAAWLLGADCQEPQWLVNGVDSPGCDWPNAGSEEIDIAEFKSDGPTVVYQNWFIQGDTRSTPCTPTVTNAQSNYHIYTFIWTPTSLTWKVDGTTTCSATTSDTPIPNQPMFLIINASAGGGGGGAISDGTLPRSNVIDYVHITEA